MAKLFKIQGKQKNIYLMKCSHSNHLSSTSFENSLQKHKIYGQTFLNVNLQKIIEISFVWVKIEKHILLSPATHHYTLPHKEVIHLLFSLFSLYGNKRNRMSLNNRKRVINKTKCAFLLAKDQCTAAKQKLSI